MPAVTLYRTVDAPARNARPALHSHVAPETPPTHLARGQVLGMSHPLDRVVVCDSGCLWLTFDGDPRDVIVHAGQQHRCDRDTRLTVEALTDATLRLH